MESEEVMIMKIRMQLQYFGGRGSAGGNAKASAEKKANTRNVEAKAITTSESVESKPSSQKKPKGVEGTEVKEFKKKGDLSFNEQFPRGDKLTLVKPDGTVTVWTHGGVTRTTIGERDASGSRRVQTYESDDWYSNEGKQRNGFFYEDLNRFIQKGGKIYHKKRKN